MVRELPARDAQEQAINRAYNGALRALPVVRGLYAIQKYGGHTLNMRGYGGDLNTSKTILRQGILFVLTQQLIDLDGDTSATEVQQRISSQVDEMDVKLDDIVGEYISSHESDPRVTLAVSYALAKYTKLRALDLLVSLQAWYPEHNEWQVQVRRTIDNLNGAMDGVILTLAEPDDSYHEEVSDVLDEVYHDLFTIPWLKKLDSHNIEAKMMTIQDIVQLILGPTK